MFLITLRQLAVHGKTDNDDKYLSVGLFVLELIVNSQFCHKVNLLLKLTDRQVTVCVDLIQFKGFVQHLVARGYSKLIMFLEIVLNSTILNPIMVEHQSNRISHGVVFVEKFQRLDLG